MQREIKAVPPCRAPSPTRPGPLVLPSLPSSTVGRYTDRGTVLCPQMPEAVESTVDPSARGSTCGLALALFVPSAKPLRISRRLRFLGTSAAAGERRCPWQFPGEAPSAPPSRAPKQDTFYSFMFIFRK